MAISFELKQENNLNGSKKKRNPYEFERIEQKKNKRLLINLK